MRQIVAALLLCAAFASVAEAKDTYIFAKDKKISVTQSEKYIEVVTEHTTYRIYPCGQLEKLTWKELNPNEDTVSLSGVWSNINAVTVPAIGFRSNIVY